MSALRRLGIAFKLGAKEGCRAAYFQRRRYVIEYFFMLSSGERLLMLTEINEVVRVLTAQSIAVEDVSTVLVEETDEFGFALAIPAQHQQVAWSALHSLMEQTGRYPLTTITWGGDQDLFSRYWYEDESNHERIVDVRPSAMLAAVASADSGAFLAARELSISNNLYGYIDQECDYTRSRFAVAPPADTLKDLVEQGIIRSYIDIERRLFQWERTTLGDHIALAPGYTGYLDWFNPNKTEILLLPCRESWQTLAYYHWYGALRPGTPTVIQLLKKWQYEYQAELVCHYGTMLQFHVGRPPSTPEQAFQLAWEQAALAECTIVLPGISLRDHARSLLALDRWFLHERP
jgi:hypothetical protein